MTEGEKEPVVKERPLLFCLHSLHFLVKVCSKSRLLQLPDCLASRYNHLKKRKRKQTSR